MGGLITIRKYDHCPDCGLAKHEHDRKRVNHSDGRFSYDYECP